ncbi:MAG: NUDIX hydrolase [Candidatus Moraniibacteriota bacterium]
MTNKLYTNSPTPELTVWGKTGNETKLAGKFGLSLISQNFTDPSSGKDDEYVFCRKAPGVTVVPVLPNGDWIITRTFKQGANAIVWEFPAGRKPKDVSATDQAKVELTEESGLIAGQMVYLGRTCVAPRKFDTYEDLFVALNCTLGTPKPGAGELLEVHQITAGEFWKLIGSGQFVSGFSEIAAVRAADFLSNNK